MHHVGLGRRSRDVGACRLLARALKKGQSRLPSDVAGWPVFGSLISGRLVLCRVGPQDGCDRVEVDEDGGPDGLERRFALPEVAVLGDEDL